MKPEELLAFRVGFIRGALDRGLFKSANVSLSPKDVVDSTTSATQASLSAIQNTGSVAGGFFLNPKTDVSATRREMEIALLEKELDEAEYRKMHALTAALLAKRKKRK